MKIKERYVFFKEGFINSVSRLLRVPVHNLSKFGSTVRKRYVSCWPINSPALEPDVVLIEYGGNDCDFNWDEVAKNPEADHQPQGHTRGL